MITNSFTRFREKVKPNTKKFNNMPDLTIETFWTCCSNQHWEWEVEGSNGNVYIVSFSEFNKGHFKYDFACTCADYEYRPHHLCKHIKEAMKYHCAWDQFVEGGEPLETEDHQFACPKCGGPLTVVKHAV